MGPDSPEVVLGKLSAASPAFETRTGPLPDTSRLEVREFNRCSINKPSKMVYRIGSSRPGHKCSGSMEITNYNTAAGKNSLPSRER